MFLTGMDKSRKSKCGCKVNKITVTCNFYYDVHLHVFSLQENWLTLFRSTSFICNFTLNIIINATLPVIVFET